MPMQTYIQPILLDHIKPPSQCSKYEVPPYVLTQRTFVPLKGGGALKRLLLCLLASLVFIQFALGIVLFPPSMAKEWEFQVRPRGREPQRSYVIEDNNSRSPPPKCRFNQCQGSPGRATSRVKCVRCQATAGYSQV